MSKASKATVVSIAVSALLGLSFGPPAQAETTASDSSDANGSSPSASASPTPDQARIAEATSKLDEAFSGQFVKGQIDRAALAPLINDVLEAVPDAVRPQAQAHIDDVLAFGEQASSQMTPEERAQLATPPAADATNAADSTNKVQIGVRGFGGFGGRGFGGWGGDGFGGFGGRGFGGWGGDGFGGFGGRGFGGWGGFGGFGGGGWGGWGGFPGSGGWGGWGGGFPGFGGWGGWGGW